MLTLPLDLETEFQRSVEQLEAERLCLIFMKDILDFLEKLCKAMTCIQNTATR